jgi:glycosyltransferase involved in cell wall biosynthesis
MPTITALIHTRSDILRLGRALETLYPCDDIVVVDHGSYDGTVDLAREYGAKVVSAPTSEQPFPVQSAELQPNHDRWILCLDPRESLTESLAASLYEWKLQPAIPNLAFSVHVREETAAGWAPRSSQETRLVPSDWTRWHGTLPIHEESARPLEGELLRFFFP